MQGFGLAILATAARIGSKGVQLGAAALRQRLLVDVEITRKDPSYPWLLQWMTHYQQRLLAEAAEPKRKLPFTSRILQRFTPKLRHLSMHTTTTIGPSGASVPHFTLVPGLGRHLIRYENAFILMSRERQSELEHNTGMPFETIKFQTLYKDRFALESLFQEAHSLARVANEGKTQIYTSWASEWKEFGHPKRKRPLSSVILEEGVKERIVEDVRAFLGSRKWYADRGVPYRRGYLLYGPPGTGKSSFIEALAGDMDFNIAMLNLSERGLTDDRLLHLLTIVPPRTIVLLEDADAAFANRRVQTDEHGYRGANVTFSGLLNALDGVASAEERIVFLTTNHIERLDPALVRPGRVDMTVRLGEATTYQMSELWDRFFDQEVDPEGKFKTAFLRKLRELGKLGRISPAELQGIFLFNKDDPQAVIDMAHMLGQRPTDMSEELK